MGAAIGARQLATMETKWWTVQLLATGYLEVKSNKQTNKCTDLEGFTYVAE